VAEDEAARVATNTIEDVTSAHVVGQGEMPCIVVVHVLSASGLAKKDLSGKSDPYVILKCGQAKEQKSKVVRKTLKPVWDNAHFQFSAVKASDELVVTMLDKDKGSKDDVMGEVRVLVSEMDGQKHSHKLQPTWKGCKVPKGELTMTCTSLSVGACTQPTLVRYKTLMH
jgi:Ca2+-dependent lipid-binding protein